MRQLLEIVPIEEELPENGGSTVAFVPGMGFTSALYNGEKVKPKWKSTITNASIDPTHWLKPVEQEK